MQGKIDVGGERGGVEVNLDEYGAVFAGMVCQRCSRLHQPRCADGEENLAASGCVDGGVQGIQREGFGEPDHVRAQVGVAFGAAGDPSTAGFDTPLTSFGATQPSAQGIVSFFPIVHYAAAIKATHLLDIAVQFEDVFAACHFVVAIHVLGDKGEVGDAGFHVHEAK